MAELPSEREISEVIGEPLARILKKNSPRRICGLLTARGRIPEWERALDHIAAHWGIEAEKIAHSRFAKKFREPDKLKEYVKRAAHAPSATRLSRINDDFGQPTGRPCLLILRDFGEPMGEEPDQTWLVVVVDYQGKLETAYPDTEKKLRIKNMLG